VQPLQKEQKLQIIHSLERLGVCQIKGAVDTVAQALRCSRYTVYNYLGEVRARNSQPVLAARLQPFYTAIVAVGTHRKLTDQEALVIACTLCKPGGRVALVGRYRDTAGDKLPLSRLLWIGFRANVAMSS